MLLWNKAQEVDTPRFRHAVPREPTEEDFLAALFAAKAIQDPNDPVFCASVCLPATIPRQGVIRPWSCCFPLMRTMTAAGANWDAPLGLGSQADYIRKVLDFDPRPEPVAGNASPRPRAFRR